jgi:non-ribosomal peptide synthetase component F
MNSHNNQSHTELSAAERHKILVEWNNTQTDYPKDKCIHQLFEEQVERTPNAIAVVFEEQQLTYQFVSRRNWIGMNLNGWQF